MSCNCSVSSGSYIPRRYMRVDGLIFDKKYVSKLEFVGDTLVIYRKGDCHPYKYKMYSEKSLTQISEYLLELNTCDSYQVDMTTDDHSKLINLDVENQHPISAINDLQNQLDSKLNKEELPNILNNKLDSIQKVNLTDLPSALDNFGKLIYVEDGGFIVFSNGISWKKIILEDI